MKIVTFGSMIIHKAIAQDAEIDNLLSIYGISPFSFSSEIPNSKIEINFDNKDLETITNIDLNKNLFGSCKSTDIDLFVIDFMSDQYEYVEWIFEDRTNYRLTLNRSAKLELEKIKKVIEKNFKKRIIEENFFDSITWNEKKLVEELDFFIEKILGLVSNDKIVLIKTSIPFQKIERNIFENRNNPKKIAEKNRFIDFCSNYFYTKTKCLYIEKINLLYLDEQNNYPESYNIYIKDSLKKIYLKNYDSKLIINKCNTELENQIDKYNLVTMIQQNNKQIMEKKLIIFGSDPKIENNSILETIINKKIILYNKKELKTNLLNEIKDLIKKNEKCIFLFLHLYNDDLLLECSKLGLILGKDLLIPSTKEILLHDFIGIYQDVYNNYISTEKILDLSIKGIAAYVEIEKASFVNDKLIINISNQVQIKMKKNIKVDLLSLEALNGSNIVIGANTTFADNCIIQVYPFMILEIGEDCMFSSKVYISCGGEPVVYLVKNEKKENYTMKFWESEKRRVVIKRHVWIGYLATILCGTKIGEGSIVGAKSVVNSRFSNNCIIAGNLAKMVRKDIAWTRGSFTKDIFNEKLIVNEIRSIGWTNLEEDI